MLLSVKDKQQKVWKQFFTFSDFSLHFERLVEQKLKEYQAIVNIWSRK
jgi:hypothetical protein